VTLTAVTATSSTFTGWSGACTGTGSCSVALTSAATVTATFTQQTQTNPRRYGRRLWQGRGASAPADNCGQTAQPCANNTIVTLPPTRGPPSSAERACTGTGPAR
jgi:hypothetical protein